jgi:hypothetical protein
MLQRAPVLRVFRRMAETSVRQHLLDSLKRSQSSNLYGRVSRLLTDDERFTGTGTGTGRLWRLTDGPHEPFDGDDRRLLAVAWSLGDFRVIRYDADARKLSPLLGADELERFVAGLLQAGAMTTGAIMHALRLRFSLEDPAPASELDPETQAGPVANPQADVLIDDLVTATLAELTERQAHVLMGLENGVTGRDLALKLGCSPGTISHERSRIRAILFRLGADAPNVLKRVLDALFTENA